MSFKFFVLRYAGMTDLAGKILTDEGRRAETFLLNFLDLREVLSSSPIYMQL